MTTEAKVETIDEFTARIGKVTNQRELAKLNAAELAGEKRKPFLAAIEIRQHERAKEIKAQRRNPPSRPRLTGDPAETRRGKVIPGNLLLPINEDENAPTLRETYFGLDEDKRELSVQVGGDKALIKQIEPTEGVTVTPKGRGLANTADMDIDTAFLNGRVEITHVYLLNGGKPIGVCELAAPVVLDPNQQAKFPAGHLFFRS